MKRFWPSGKGRGDMENKLEIVLGTSNPHKVHEMNEIAKGRGITFVLPTSNNFDPVENGETFEENAKIKALEAARVSLGKLFLADDSGLCVDYLNGAPGIHSARYDTTPQKRIDKLLGALAGADERGAHFVCALCLVDDKGRVIHTETGKVYGEIAEKQKGEGGFGYDPVFIVKGLNKTMAELTEEEKNTLSHRGQAMNRMLEWIENSFNQR